MPHSQVLLSHSVCSSGARLVGASTHGKPSLAKPSSYTINVHFFLKSQMLNTALGPSEWSINLIKQGAKDAAPFPHLQSKGMTPPSQSTFMGGGGGGHQILQFVAKPLQSKGMPPPPPSFTNPPVYVWGGGGGRASKSSVCGGQNLVLSPL